MHENEISYATVKNWEKLNTNSEGRLEKRANKRRSKKRIIPGEYLENKENIAIIEKIAGLAAGKDIKNIMYTLSLIFLKSVGISEDGNVKTVMTEYNGYSYLSEFEDILLPSDEYDFLGAVYQSLLFEGRKNTIGSYYTPRKIVEDMVSDIDLTKNQTFLDPCCGSGAYILALKNAQPENIFGFDSDPVAVMLAKVNLLIKYADSDFLPKIFCRDYLLDKEESQYDYISTNPPWGALLTEMQKKESFSCFFKKAYSQLKEGGKIRFLFPESILNVKVHKDIREFLLKCCKLESITVYNNDFSGVTTKYVNISAKKAEPGKTVIYKSGNREEIVSTKAFELTENLTFNMLCNEDIAILNKAKRIGKYNLSDSVWALGIVTGDNKNKLFAEPGVQREKIYTGREIERYRLKCAKNYIVYDPKNLQQTAKEEIYRADEKLVYKFISDRLVFAYDDSGALFLNSANILIPKIPGMSVKTVMAFLNSELYSYFYRKLFGEVKVLKGNLINLPFARIDSSLNEKTDRLAERVIHELSDDAEEELQSLIYQVFEMTESEIKYIKDELKRK